MSFRGTRLAATFVAFLLAIAVTAITARASAGDRTVVRGTVMAGDTPIAFSRIQLYATSDLGEPVLVGSGSTDVNGRFRIHYREPGGDAVLYLQSRRGFLVDGLYRLRGVPPAVEMAVALAPGDRPVEVVLNELTTIATGAALAQFMDKGAIRGKNPGLRNAAAMIRNLVDPSTGQIGGLLVTEATAATETPSTFNSLGNILHECTSRPSTCGRLLALAGPGAHTTLEAIATITADPSRNAGAIFTLQSELFYTPARDTAPDAWLLALKVVGNGREFDGPGNVAVDAEGNVWANNNYVWSLDPLEVCASHLLFKVAPYLEGAPVASFRGGGLSGAGFGIGIDPTGDVWVGNFGFAGSLCIDPIIPPSNSVSQFSPAGDAISGPLGHTQGDIDWPQGTVSDPFGNIWIASCNDGHVTVYPDGNPNDAKVAPGAVEHAFDISTDDDGNAWVTSASTNRVYGFDPDLEPLPGSPYTSPDLNVPMGIAIDSQGNNWIANQGIMDPPCGTPYAQLALPDGSELLQGTISLLDHEGQLHTFGKPGDGGLTLPWGIAVDGDDQVWVANFAGQRLSRFCGTDASTCPAGTKTGDAISPTQGYGFDGLQRNTGVAIDGSGNVWVTNNWKRIPVQFNPGGDGLVVFVGAAAPLKTPSIGLPKRP